VIHDDLNDKRCISYFLGVENTYYLA